jgi:hypothetical protein
MTNFAYPDKIVLGCLEAVFTNKDVYPGYDLDMS